MFNGLGKFVGNKRSINFVAQWTPKVLTIVFHKNDGSNVTETRTYTFDGNMDDDRLNPMSNLNQRNGYNFGGWNFYANGSDNHNYPFNDIIGTTWFDTQVGNASSKTINLYAKRTPKTITITLDKQGGNGRTSTFYYKYGTNQFYSNYACTSQITSIEKPTRNGYTFVHYYGDGRHGGENGERYAKYDSTEFAGDLDDDIYEDATLYAGWCQNCDPGEGATCVLSAKSETYKVNCTYTTSCKVGYENLQNAGTYHPSCTPKSCPQQGACGRAAHGSQCTTYNRCSSTAIQSTCNLGSWSTNPGSYKYANQGCSSCPASNGCSTTTNHNGQCTTYSTTSSSNCSSYKRISTCTDGHRDNSPLAFSSCTTYVPPTPDPTPTYSCDCSSCTSSLSHEGGLSGCLACAWEIERTSSGSCMCSGKCH